MVIAAQDLRPFASRRGEGASRTEVAAGIGLPQVGQAAGDRREAPGMRTVGAGQRGQQSLGVGMARAAQHFARHTRLGQAPRVKHGDAVAQPIDDAEIVADQQHGQAASLSKLVEQGQDLRLDRDVQRGGGLVEQKQVGLAGQRRGDADALLHAAGQLVRIAAHHLGRARNAHFGQQFRAALPGGALFRAEMHAHRLGDLRADGQCRIERRRGILEHHADAPAAHGGCVAQQIMPVEGEAFCFDSCRRPEQPEQCQNDGRFAGAGLAHEPQDAAGRNGEGYVVQRLQPSRARGIGDRQRLDLQRRADDGSVTHVRGP